MVTLAHEHHGKEGEPVPEKLHFPEERYCHNGHELVDEDGHPTNDLAWDYAGNPRCGHPDEEEARWNILRAVKEHAGVTDKECPNGHAITPDTVNYIFRTDGSVHHVEMKCKVCGAAISGKKEIKKAGPAPVKFSAKEHEAAMESGKYHDSEFGRAAMAHFAHYSAKDTTGYEERGRSSGSDVMPARKSNPEPWNIGEMIDRGFKAGALKDGDQVSWDHFIPLAVGGSNTPDNMVAVSKRFNEAKGDSLPSTYEVNKFGMHHLMHVVKALNPQDIGYLNENDDVIKGESHGFIRDKEGKITKKIERGGDSLGAGTIKSSDFPGVSGVRGRRLYGEDGTPGGRKVTPSGRVISVNYEGEGVDVLPGAKTAKAKAEKKGDEIRLLGTLRYNPLQTSDRARVKPGQPRHEADIAVQKKIAAQEQIAAGRKGDVAGYGQQTLAVPNHEFVNGKRNKWAQDYLDSVVKTMGPIPGFDHSETGQSMHHLVMDAQGKVVKVIPNPALKAHILQFAQQQGAEHVLPQRVPLPEGEPDREPVEHEKIAFHASRLLGQPSKFTLPEEHHATFIQNLAATTGPIDWRKNPSLPATPENMHPQSIFVDHPKGEGKIINPALRRHVRNYAKEAGGYKGSRIVQMQLSEDLPVTLRKVKNHGANELHTAQHRRNPRPAHAHHHSALWLRGQGRG